MEITKEQIANWKKEFGSIFKIEPIAGMPIIFRTLTREDYMDIMNAQLSGTIDDPELETVKKCVLNDITEETYIQRGGLVTVIYEDIMKRSGFVVVESEEL